MQNLIHKLTPIGLFLVVLLLPSLGSAQGMLVPTDRRVAPLSIAYQRVQVDIQDGTAVTLVDQAFRNPSNRILEATYIFPVPEGATVDDFALYINGKRTTGKVLERNKARGIYESIVRSLKDPGLIEWMGKDLFQARVFPIPARGEQRIEIRFSQVLPFEGGVYRYVYPLKGAKGPSNTTDEDFTLTAKIRSRTPIRSLYSPSHEVYTRKKNDHEAIAGIEKMHSQLNQDFVLYYTVSPKDIGLNLLTHRVAGKPGFFLLMAAPKSTYEGDAISHKTVTFVLDTSGSMHGKKMADGISALVYCLKNLDKGDRFNIIRFSSDVELWKDGPQQASSANVKEAVEFVSGFEAAGGTAAHEALTEALKSADVDRSMIVFITDGRPTVGTTDVATIVKDVKKANKGDHRIFAFGVGTDLNTHLLDRVSGNNSGTTSYVRGDGDLEKTVATFFDKVSHPVLSNLSLDISGVKAYSTLPAPLPDLFRGTQLIVVGRYRQDGDSLVRLEGELSGSKTRYDYEGIFPKENEENAYIAKLWAQRQIAYLLDEIRLNGEKKELKDEVIQLATDYGIVTPFTSYLVLEPGMSYDGVSPNPRRRVRRGRFDDTDGNFGGVGSSTGRGGSGTSAPRSAPALAFEEKDLSADEGSGAVNASKKIQKMKESGQAKDDGYSAVRRVRGKVFDWKAGRWVDRASKKGKKRLKIKYMSDGYFTLIREVPELAEYLGIGENVTIEWRGTILEIGPTGNKSLKKSEIRSLQSR